MGGKFRPHSTRVLDTRRVLVPALFPKWFNMVPTAGAIGSLGAAVAVTGAVWYWWTPEYWEVGYMPAQPAFSSEYLAKYREADPNLPLPGVEYPAFSHQIHAGKLGLDCRYCHTKVETSPEANVPNVATCYGCHAPGHVSMEKSQDDRVKFIRDAYLEDRSLEWRRIHKLPDYVRNFPHNVHLKAGVSCFSCHGQITAMPVVFQQYSLSMSWCLDCHRGVKAGDTTRLVPHDKVTDLYWVQNQWMANPTEHAAEGRKLIESLKGVPPENCGACHY